jgi:hypothetical protein
VSARSGAGRTPNSFKAFSYSLNTSSRLFSISEISLFEASFWLARALSRS